MAVKHSPIEVGTVIGRIQVLDRAGYIRGHRTGWACVCTVCGQKLQLEGYQIREMGCRPCKYNPNAKSRKKRAVAKQRTGTTPATQPEKPIAKPDAPQVIRPTMKTLELYNALPAEARAAVDADIEIRLRTLRKYKISAGNLNVLYDEAISIARTEAGGPPPQEREKYEPRRAYPQYQSPKGA